MQRFPCCAACCAVRPSTRSIPHVHPPIPDGLVSCKVAVPEPGRGRSVGLPVMRRGMCQHAATSWTALSAQGMRGSTPVPRTRLHPGACMRTMECAARQRFGATLGFAAIEVCRAATAAPQAAQVLPAPHMHAAQWRAAHACAVASLGSGERCERAFRTRPQTRVQGADARGRGPAAPARGAAARRGAAAARPRRGGPPTAASTPPPPVSATRPAPTPLLRHGADVCVARWCVWHTARLWYLALSLGFCHGFGEQFRWSCAARLGDPSTAQSPAPISHTQRAAQLCRPICRRLDPIWERQCSLCRIGPGTRSAAGQLRRMAAVTCTAAPRHTHLQCGAAPPASRWTCERIRPHCQRTV